MAFLTPSVIGAILAASATAASAGAGIYASNQAADANKRSSGIARDNLQNAVNQQGYTAALNALALKRSTAGTTDGRGSTTTYDPATNSWKTALSPEAQAIQRSTDQASISRNTRDLNTAQDANSGAMLDAIKARGASGPALAAVENFRPISSRELEGNLQEVATTANRQATAPVIADTLRQFARTGTAAGPVLTNMMRDNATSLRTTMLNDAIAAKRNVGDINNATLATLMNKYTGLRSGSQPTLNFSPLSADNPNTELTTQMAQRAAGAAQPAGMAAYTTSAATGQTNNAGQYAAGHVPVNTSGTDAMALAKSFSNLTDPNNPFMKYFNNGAGNEGDKGNPIRASFGDINANGKGMFGLQGAV